MKDNYLKELQKEGIVVIENFFTKKKCDRIIKQIEDFLVHRYGEYILFKPRFDRKNLILWILPFIIFCVSTIILIFRLKTKNSK